MLKARLTFFVLLGAMLGLFGQGLAYAAGPALVPATQVSHAMSSDMNCGDMAATREVGHKQPCKGMTLACIATMGCVVPMTLEEPRPASERATVVQLPATWPPSAVLAGLAIPPEPQPPNV